MKFLKKLLHYAKKTAVFTGKFVFWLLTFCFAEGTIISILTILLGCDSNIIVFFSLLLMEIVIIILLWYSLLMNQKKFSYIMGICFWLFFILMEVFKDTLYTNCSGFLWDPD